MLVAPGNASQSIDVQIVDDSGLPVTGLLAATFPPVLYSLGNNTAATSITLSDLAAITTAYSSGGVKERSGGWYRLDLPNAAQSATATTSLIGEATGKHLLFTPIVIGGNVNAGQLGGTTQTGRDIGTSVLLSAGTSAGQLDFTSGVVKSNLVQILATALTETAGFLAAGFKKFFNVATPTGTLNDLPGVNPGLQGGLPLLDGSLSIRSNLLFRGSAFAGSTAQTILMTTVFADNQFRYCLVTIESGTGAGQVRLISQYVKSTGALTVAKSFITAPDNTSVINILPMAEAGIATSGVATAGSTTTLTLAANASAVDGQHKYQLVCIVGGTGAGQSNFCIGYVGSTKVATMAETWATTPDNTSVYQIMFEGRAVAEVVSDKTGYALSNAAYQAIQQVVSGYATTAFVASTGNATTDGASLKTAAEAAALATRVFVSPGIFSPASFPISITTAMALAGTDPASTTLSLSSASQPARMLYVNSANGAIVRDLSIDMIGQYTEPIAITGPGNLLVENVSLNGQFDGVVGVNDVSTPTGTITISKCLIRTSEDTVAFSSGTPAIIIRDSVIYAKSASGQTPSGPNIAGGNLTIIDTTITIDDAGTGIAGVGVNITAGTAILINVEIVLKGSACLALQGGDSGTFVCFGCTFDRTKTTGSVIDLPLSALPVQTTANNTVATNLDATVSSRASQTSVNTLQTTATNTLTEATTAASNAATAASEATTAATNAAAATTAINTKVSTALTYSGGLPNVNATTSPPGLSGVATAGTATTITFGVSAPDGIYNGQLININLGSANQQVRRIVGFVSNVATVDFPWSAAALPTAGTPYNLPGINPQSTTVVRATSNQVIVQPTP